MKSAPELRSLLLLVLAAACGDSSGPGGGGGGDTDPTQTAIGTPNGAAASQSIGPAGGTVASTDGVVSLTIPAGALSAATTITVQPIAALAPGAIAAYRLGPDGTQFATPVSLTFHYTVEQMDGSAPEVTWIAFQEASGAWRYVDDLTLDTAARTLTAQVTHFSDWTHVQGLQLRPPSAEVDPNGSVELEIKDCMTAVEGPIYAFDCVSFDFGDGDDLPALPTRDNPRGSVDASSWAVNGDPEGSGILGLILGTDVGAEFRAPTQAPEEGNPVAVSVDIVDLNNRRVATLISNIRINGLLPTIHVVGGMDTTNIGIAVLVGADVTDKIEFDMELKPDGSLAFSNIQNFPSTYTNARLPAEATFCRYTLDSPFEFGTYTEFTGGNTNIDSVIVSMGGTQTIAGSTYYVPVDGACTGSVSYPGLTGPGVGVLFEFAPALLDQVGDDVVVLGTGPGGEWNGWVFSLRRTR